MTYIQSRQNQRYKNWKKLFTKKGRGAQGRFWVEGEHLVQEVLASAWSVTELIVSEDYKPGSQLARQFQTANLRPFILPAPLFTELTETKTPQGIAAVVRINIPDSVSAGPKPAGSASSGSTFSESIFPDPAELLQGSRLLLLVDQVRDPGNLGTMIRTADAAGVDAVFLGKGTVDPYSGKVIRSTQGSLFHIPFYKQDLAAVISSIQEQGGGVIGTGPEEVADYRSLSIPNDQPVAVLLGNEGEGVQPHLLRKADQKVKIPIWGQAESLNVAVATGIMLYHIRSQLGST